MTIVARFDAGAEGLPQRGAVRPKGGHPPGPVPHHPGLPSPWIVAGMLAQLDVRPGQSVLEIGSGGYQAALLRELTGPDGSVTTVDIDPEVTDRARLPGPVAGHRPGPLPAQGWPGRRRPGPSRRVLEDEHSRPVQRRQPRLPRPDAPGRRRGHGLRVRRLRARPTRRGTRRTADRPLPGLGPRPPPRTRAQS
jgi:hypothetical protein